MHDVNALRQVQLFFKLRGVWNDAKKEARMATAGMTEVQGRSLTSTKTFWVNLLSGLGGVGGWAAGIVPPEYMPVIIGVTALVNILLKRYTTVQQPVTATIGDAPPVLLPKS